MWAPTMWTLCLCGKVWLRVHVGGRGEEDEVGRVCTSTSKTCVCVS